MSAAEGVGPEQGNRHGYTLGKPAAAVAVERTSVDIDGVWWTVERQLAAVAAAVAGVLVSFEGLAGAAVGVSLAALDSELDSDVALAVSFAASPAALAVGDDDGFGSAPRESLR